MAGKLPNLALAEFVTRPQAEAQIGAVQIITGAAGSSIRPGAAGLDPRYFAASIAFICFSRSPPADFSRAASSAGSGVPDQRRSSCASSARKRDGWHSTVSPARRRRRQIRQVQAPLRARDADVEQPPLLVDVAARDRFAVRQQSFLQADQEDMGELEPFRRVQRRQPHRVRRARRPRPSSMVMRAINCVSSRRFFRSASPLADSQATKSRTLCQRVCACLRSQVESRKSS